MARRLADCHNVEDLRALAKRRLPGPIFNYIDGAADDEVTCRRNTEAFEAADLVPNVLAGAAEVDLSVTVMGQKLAMPLFCSPTALQRLFHHDGERAVARAAEKFGTMFGVSSLGTVSLAEIGAMISTPKMFQFYFHKDRGLNAAMVERAKAARFDVLALTVDTITGGNRERDLRTGFTSPPRLTLKSLASFAAHPGWAFNYLTREPFELAELKSHVREGSNVAVSVAEYFSTLLDPAMSWKDAERLRAAWGGPFCLKGVMSVEDARRAIDIVLDGGVRRGTHVLKAIAAGATACSGGRMYLYALAAAGQAGVERALGLLRAEIERDMRLMGVAKVSELTRAMLRWR
jgi:L-lactate dehydrogenase (cytochrome)